MATAAIAGSPNYDNVSLYSKDSSKIIRNYSIYLSLAISDDGNYVAGWQYGNTQGDPPLVLFKRDDTDPLWEFDLHVNAVDISDNGEYIAVGNHYGVTLFSKSSETPIWTYETNWEITSGSSASIGVWALDGDSVSPTLMSIIPIIEDEGLDIFGWIIGSGLPLVILVICMLISVGMVIVSNRRREIERDLELIQSWSSFEPIDDERDES